MGKGFEYRFLQRRHTDGQEAGKRCSTSLIIQHMQIKHIVRYHLASIRTAITKKIIKYQVLARTWRTWNACALLVGR